MDQVKFLSLLQAAGLKVYEKSVDAAAGTFCAIVRGAGGKQLAVAGTAADSFCGEASGELKLCALTVDNAKALMALFPYTKPVSRGSRTFSFGMGDRLGLATPGHIHAIAGYDVFPVFAQQSIRELNLTGRTFPEVIAAAAFSVFQEGYKDGYGADGDHLKTIEEIDYALKSGCTMITLDCSEHIDTGAVSLSLEALKSAYAAVPEDVRTHYESVYGNKELPVIGAIDEETLQRIVLTFYKAVQHAKICYAHMITLNDQVDFEMSIDETLTCTTPAEHFVVGSELTAAGIKVSSMAPHFCGAFEKGIDYVGDVAQLTRELEEHQQIAQHFGYRLSLHSGSDKFTVFPLYGKTTQCNAHVKIAGTNWLEAVRVLSQHNPALFRKALAFSIEHRKEAEKYYHISSHVEDIVPLDSRTDDELPKYLCEDAARQTIHITYGLLLAEAWFRDPFFAFMDAHEAEYAAALKAHVGKHLTMLTCGEYKIKK